MTEASALTAADVARARVQAAASGQGLVATLQAGSGLDNGDFTQALGRLTGFPTFAMAELLVLEPRFDVIGFRECSQRGLAVVVDTAGRLLLLLSDPLDGAAECWARHRLAAAHLRQVVAALVHPDDFAACLTRFERRLRAIDGVSTDAGATAPATDVAAVISLSSIGGDESSVVRLVNSTIYDALKLGASDIHLECDGAQLHVQYRVDGVLTPVTSVTGQDLAEQVISRIKVMAELDIAERRVPQDGRFKVRVNQRDIDFRVSVMPNIFGEDAVLRLLDRQALSDRPASLRLDDLGLDALTMGHIRRLALQPHGMLLVTGPTGSGKTTTLYAAISEIHTGRDKIVTIEDPVEYRLPRVLQIPVNEKKGLTFARGLRSILRHDPDKIMVGEIRDGETAQIAVQAALTGHLVFTTVHANNVFDVLGRFLHMAVDAYSFSAALNGIVAQRLLRLNCPECAAPQPPDPADIAHFGDDGLGRAGALWMAGPGCGHCRGSGFKGRKAVAEVLLLDDALRESITRRAPISQLKDDARQRGWVALREAALACATRGETTLAEVRRVVG